MGAAAFGLATTTQFDCGLEGFTPSPGEPSMPVPLPAQWNVTVYATQAHHKDSHGDGPRPRK